MLYYAEDKVSLEKKNDDPDSDSSSLPSVEEEEDKKKVNTEDDKKKKTVKKETSTKSEKVSPWLCCHALWLFRDRKYSKRPKLSS